MKNLKVSRLVKAGMLSLAVVGMSANYASAKVLGYEGGVKVEVLQNGPITDEELKLYIQANENINKIKEEASARVVEIVNEEGLDPKAYNELSRAERSGVATAEAEQISEEDKAKYERVKKKTAELQEELNKRAGEAVKNSGLAIAKFNQIQKSVASDPSMRERMERLAANTTNNPEQQGMGAGSEVED